MSMVVPYFSPEGQKNAARQDESLLDKLLQDGGHLFASPRERLQGVLGLFEDDDPILVGTKEP